MGETVEDPRDPEAMVKAFLQYKIMEQMQDYLNGGRRFAKSVWKQPASCLLEREDCTPAACYRSLYAPRAGGAYDSHHRTAGIAGCTRRRGGSVAARGARG